MFNIYIMKKDFTPISIGSVNRENNNITINKSGISSVDNFNNQICNYILKDNGIEENVDEWFTSEDITGVCYHILRWRRLTAYLIIQISDKGIRYLCYFSDEVKHHGQSFGTSMETVDSKQVYDVLEKELKNFLYNNKTLKTFLNQKRLYMLSTLSNYKEFFGI